jgi:hypothetical protein
MSERERKIAIQTTKTAFVRMFVEGRGKGLKGHKKNVQRIKLCAKCN